MTRPLDTVVQQLSAASRTNAWDPWSDLEWPEVLTPDSGWCTSPELVSLYGTELWSSLAEAARRRIAFFEAVNFFSLNIHGERLLMEGLARRLYQPRLARLAPYLHHFLDEENRHSVVFATFCRRYAGGVYTDRKLRLPASRTPLEEDFLFFAQVVLFEEIVDALNVAMADDTELVPIAREINARHHADEARHLAFGRRVVQELADDPAWTAASRADVAELLGSFLEASWREHVNPAAYRDAGIDEPWRAREAAWSSPDFAGRRAALSAKPVRFLRDLGFPVR